MEYVYTLGVAFIRDLAIYRESSQLAIVIKNQWPSQYNSTVSASRDHSADSRSVVPTMGSHTHCWNLLARAGIGF